MQLFFLSRLDFIKAIFKVNPTKTNYLILETDGIAIGDRESKYLRPEASFSLHGLPPRVKFTPRMYLAPRGEFCPLGECSPLRSLPGVNTLCYFEEWRGEQRISLPMNNFTLGCQLHPWGPKFAPRGEVKNGPLDGLLDELSRTCHIYLTIEVTTSVMYT
jgi:hypothetical protein